MTLTVGSLFSGVGLLDFGLELADGFEHRWFCESDPFRREILALRWPGAAIYDDVRTLDANVGGVDVIAGGFPCKGASTAGKRDGFDNPETVLWREMARTVRELRPRYVLVENVAAILSLRHGSVWGEVLGTLAALGYDVEWDCLPAAAVGAPHLRDRVLAIAADSDEAGRRERGGRVAGAVESSAAQRCCAIAPDSRGERLQSLGRGGGRSKASDGGWPHSNHIPGGPSSAQLPAAGSTPADADGRRREERAQRDERTPSRLAASLGNYLERCGPEVEWGEYERAIQRWAGVRGAAPIPLVCRVDDRRTSRLDRSRLSALGDGVQVQVGLLAGLRILELDSERSA